MAKWKCNDTACLHQWSEKDPTSCPQCGSTDFEIIPGNQLPWKIIGIIVAVIIILLLMTKCNSCGSNSTTATINFNQTTGSIKVDLDIKDKDKKDYIIELLRSGTTYESAKGLKSKTFTGLNSGTYYVNVKYIGKKIGSDIPNIIFDKTKGPFIIVEPKKPLVPPSIVGVLPVPNSHTQKYTITIKIKPDSLTKLCEFSIDGSNFSSSNVFNNVSAGTYNAIEARLIDDNSMNDTYPPITLLPIINTPPPTQATIEGLLKKISSGDNNAFDKLFSLISTANVKVTGTGSGIQTLYDLMMDCNSGNQYVIQNMSVTNNQITLINVRKIL